MQELESEKKRRELGVILCPYADVCIKLACSIFLMENKRQVGTDSLLELLESGCILPGALQHYQKGYAGFSYDPENLPASTPNNINVNLCPEVYERKSFEQCYEYQINNNPKKKMEFFVKRLDQLALHRFCPQR